MSTETERLAREAEERRSHLDSTLDTLKDRFSPGQLVDEATNYLRSGQGAEMVQNLNRQVRDNPLALGLIGAGAAWLLFGQGVRDTTRSTVDRYRDDRPGYRPRSFEERDWSADNWEADDRDNRFEGADTTRGREATARGVVSGPYPGAFSSSPTGGVGDTISRAGETLREGASGAAGSVADAARSAGDTVSSAASDAASSVRRFAHDAGDAAGRTGERLQRGVSHAGDSVSRFGQRARRSFFETLQDEPLILGAVAVAVGAAIGAALPSTRTEDEWLGATRDRLRDDAIDYGRDAVDTAAHAASSALEAGQAEADRQGLTPSGNDKTLAERASAVASAATDAARKEADL